MGCKEVPMGNGSSRIENTADDEGWDEFDRGYALGYAAARRGQKINSTIYILDHNFRSGYLDGYTEYQDSAIRFHRDDAGMVD